MVRRLSGLTATPLPNVNGYAKDRPLLAQVLMASTYPLEVVQADRFAKANKGLKGDKLTKRRTSRIGM